MTAKHTHTHASGAPKPTADKPTADASSSWAHSARVCAIPPPARNLQQTQTYSRRALQPAIAHYFPLGRKFKGFSHFGTKSRISKMVGKWPEFDRTLVEFDRKLVLSTSLSRSSTRVCQGKNQGFSFFQAHRARPHESAKEKFKDFRFFNEKYDCWSYFREILPK